MTQQYLEYLLQVQGNSSQTYLNYNRYLNFFIATSGVRSVTDVNLKHIDDFIIFCKNNNYKNQTINYMLTAIRCWLKYELRTTKNDKILSAKLIDNLKFKKTKIEIPTQAILNSVTELTKTLPLRDKVILELFLSTGLRLSELKNIKVSDIDFTDGSISVLGKGDKLRVVFLSEKMKLLLKEYIKEDQEVLFPFTVKTIYRIIKDIGKKVGHNIHPHKLRHVFATNMLENEAPIQIVQHLLGHSSIQTTEMYSHIRNSSLKKAFEKYHGNN